MTGTGVNIQNKVQCRMRVLTYPLSKAFRRSRLAGGAEVLFLLMEVEPISGKESEQYPDSYPKEYRERVEKFLRNYIWRKITGDITIEFLEAAVERMFTADEVSGVVDLAKLKELSTSSSTSFFTQGRRDEIAGIDKKLLAARHKAAIAGNAFG